MMGQRAKLKGGWEWDILTPYAKRYTRYKRHTKRYTKTRFNKRVRREMKAATQRSLCNG